MPPNAGTSNFNERKAVEIMAPAKITTPVIFASPHSGREYPADLLNNSRLGHHELRQSEDSYVDLLFNAAPGCGAPLLRALFPRAYVDVNRARDELDPRMFSDPVPGAADGRSSRVVAGLGVIPRIVADGHDIYARKLYYRDAQRRLSTCYDSYHASLSQLIDNAVDKFGRAVIIDCHSMPSISSASMRRSEFTTDIVLGDRFGVACEPDLMDYIEAQLSSFGYETARNAPYAGGYVAASYGRPKRGVHVIQIEINRRLYLDEKRVARTGNFDNLRADMTGFIENITSFQSRANYSRIAAE